MYTTRTIQQAIDLKSTAACVRYIGKKANGQTILSCSISDVSVGSVKIFGPLLVLNTIAGEIELSPMLGPFGDEILSLVYDVTNTYFYGKKCPLAKYGKDKEGVKGRPLIQIGLGVTKQKGMPVMHKVYEGHIHDSRTLRDMLTGLREFNFKQGYIVFDRGISSKKNQQEINSLDWKVICGLPLNL